MYIRGFAVWFKQFAQHMPVYLITAHAYRSWSEGDPKGYVQRGEGLMPPSSALARYRARKAKHPEVRFEGEMQQVLNFVIESIVPEKGAKLHACVTCPTHVHILFVQDARMWMQWCRILCKRMRGERVCRRCAGKTQKKNGAGTREVGRNTRKTVVFKRMGFDARSQTKSF